jgi:hypothetical protein
MLFRTCSYEDPFEQVLVYAYISGCLDNLANGVRALEDTNTYGRHFHTHLAYMVIECPFLWLCIAMSTCIINENV